MLKLRPSLLYVNCVYVYPDDAQCNVITSPRPCKDGNSEAGSIFLCFLTSLVP